MQPIEPSIKERRSFTIIFAYGCLLITRFVLHIMMTFSHREIDHDEINYWELIYNFVYYQKTWEYSPEYTLQFYTYLMLHSWLAWVFNAIFHPYPVKIFYFVRCFRVSIHAICESYFIMTMLRKFGVYTGGTWMILQNMCLHSAIFSASLLPSSFSMCLCFATIGAWWNQKFPLAIFSAILSSILGYPPAALIGIPIFIDAVFVQKKMKIFVIWAAASVAIIFSPMIAINSAYYGKLTIVPMKLAGNNMTSNKTLSYATGPWTSNFYDLTIPFVLSLLTPFLLTIYHRICSSNARTYLLDCLTILPFYIWLAVFSLLPHIDFHFLRPVHPLLFFCGAISLKLIANIFRRIDVPLDYVILLFILIANFVMFILRLTTFFPPNNVPVSIFEKLNAFHRHHETDAYNICTSEDWNVPIRFFLPSPNYRLRIVQPEFISSDGKNGTSPVDGHTLLNDTDCHFILNWDSPMNRDLELCCGKESDVWSILDRRTFFNPDEVENVYNTPLRMISRHSEAYLLARKSVIRRNAFYRPI